MPFQGQPVSKSTTPLTENQRGWWALIQQCPQTTAYQIQVNFQIRRDCKVDMLQQALFATMAQYPSLRSTVTTLQGQPHFQQSFSPKQFALQEIYINPDQYAERTDKLVNQPFALEREPLLRAWYIDSGESHCHLMLCIHHLVFDGVSMTLFSKAFWENYTTLLQQGKVNNTENLDHVNCPQLEQHYLTSPTAQADLAYWRNHLDGELPSLNLPTDIPRTADTGHLGRSKTYTLGPDLSNALNAFKTSHQTTTATVLFGIYQLLLTRYTGQQEFVVGLPTQGRKYGIADAFGYHANLLPIRARLDTEQTFVHLLAELGQTVKKGVQHGAYPFSLLAVDEHIQQSNSGAAIIQTTFAYQGMFHHITKKLGQHYSDYGLMEIYGRQQADRDLSLEVFKTDNDYQLVFKYNAELYQQQTIDNLFGNYVTLLEAVMNNPCRPLHSYDCLTAAQSQQILYQYNDTAAQYPSEQTLHGLFEIQAAKHPERCAVICNEAQLSFDQLNQKANRLAQALRERGLGPDVPVAIRFDRSVEMVVAILGILKAGAAYVPINPAFTKARIEYILQDTHAPLLLTQPSLTDPELTFQGQTVLLDGDDSWLNSYSPENHHFAGPARASELCYIIYTSGSTGNPKGVMIEHRGVVNLAFHLKAELDQFPLGDNPVWGWNASYAFDASVQALSQLMLGVTCHLIPEAVRKDSQRLARFINDNQIDLFDGTPSQLKLLLGAFEHVGQQRPLFSFVGGETIHPDLWKRIAEHNQATGGLAFNVYGLTECSVDSTISPITADLPPSIGKPMHNTQIYLLDKHGMPVPHGVPGEICIASDGLARGYLNLPQKTAECFIRNPFDTRGKTRLYKTGDQGRYLPDGNIEFLGRLDNQVKLRGYRIELGEIESQLTNIDGVAKAVACVQTDAQGNQLLVAYLMADPQQVCTDQIRTHLAHHLPDYMVPAAYQYHDQFSLTPSGKIDRKILQQQPVEVCSDNPYVAPRNALEQHLCQLWQQHLNVEQVGIDDTFQSLGGHSLLAMELVNHINLTAEHPLGIHQFMQHKTIRKLAKLLGSQQDEKSQNPLLVPLFSGGSHPEHSKVFFVHGIGGTVISFYPLVEQLQAHAPLACYGIESPGINIGGPLYHCADQMIEQYTRAILAEQSEGPYHIVGWSYGSMVAKQIVKRLEQLGKTVRRFVSIDAQAPDPAMLKQHFGHLAGSAQDEPVLEIRDEHLQTLLGIYGQLFNKPGDTNLPLLDQLCDQLGFAPTQDSGLKQQYARLTFSHLINGSRFCQSPVNAQQSLIIKASNTRYPDFQSRWTAQLEGPHHFVEHDGDHWSILQQPAVGAQIASFLR